MPGNRHVPFLGEGAAATLLPLPDFLAAFLSTAHDVPSCARYQVPWEGAEARLRAAQERLEERAKEGQDLPRSFGMPRAGARLPKNRDEATPEPLFLLRGGSVEAWKHRPEPPLL